MTTQTNAALPRVIFWQQNPAKLAEFAQWQIDRNAWDAKLYSAFPNAHLLDPIYDMADFQRMELWKETNVAPQRPFCPDCGHPPHPQDLRWCCNEHCESYLL